MNSVRKFFKHLNQTKTGLLIGQLIVGFGILITIIGLIEFITKSNALNQTELSAYWLTVSKKSNLFTIHSLGFELNWTPTYFKEIIIYHSLAKLPLMFLLIYVFQQLKCVFHTFEESGQPFTYKSVKAFKRVGIAIIVTFVFKMIFDIIYPMAIMIKHNNTIKTGDLIGSSDLRIDFTTIFVVSMIASLFLGLSHMFKKGLEINEDIESIV